MRRGSVAVLVLFMCAFAACAGTASTASIATATASGTADHIPIAVMKPDGPGPFPAVVIMHDCSGLGGRSSGAPDRWGRPLLILIGEKDDWTPAEACKRLTEAAQQAGYPVAIKIYAGAHHSFDSSNPVRYVPTRINGNAPGGRGATTGGDPAAWADAIREVVAFFGRHLK